MDLSIALSVAILALALTLRTANAQQATDEAAIRAVLARETEGWDKFNAKEVASTFTEDAIWQNPFGVRTSWRCGNQKVPYRSHGATRFRAGKTPAPLKSWISVLRLRPQPRSGAMNGIEGLVNDVSGNTMQPRHSYYLKILVGKGWRLEDQDCLIMDVVHLK